MIFALSQPASASCMLQNCWGPESLTAIRFNALQSDLAQTEISYQSLQPRVLELQLPYALSVHSLASVPERRHAL